MILRRPYAFLIKYFKIIHVFLFGLFGFLLFSLRKIYLFLIDYVKKGTFNYTDNIAGKYVPIILIVLLFIAIISGIFIYLLMKRKEKPSLFYILLTAYSGIAFFLLIFYRNFFASLELTSYETLTIIIYRDIMAFLYYICYFFVGVLFIRAFGFDIKKFSFEKDKRELNLDVTDSEEVELGVSVDKYDALKALRKQKRELGYYYRENDKFFNILAIVLVAGIIIFLYIHFFVNNKVYSETSTISLGNIDFKVIESFVTDKDGYQKIVSPNNNFLVMNLQINNKNDSTYYFDREIFRIAYNDNYLYPATSYCSSFSDIGNCYTPNSKIQKGNQEFILIFKISEPSFNGYFEILKNKSDNYKYERMRIKSSPIEVARENYEMNNNYFNVTNHTFVDNTSVEHNECDKDGNCVINKKNLYSDFDKKIMILTVSNISDFTEEFLENYLGIYYKVNNTIYDITSDKIDILDINENNIYITVPKIVLNQKENGLVFKTRRKAIYIKLGGNNE